MSEKKKEVNLVQAFSHDLRREVWRQIYESTAEWGVSPRELATKLGHPLSNLSYHVRVLAAAAAITCSKTVPVRGSMQHFYKINPDVAGLGWVQMLMEVGAPTTA